MTFEDFLSKLSTLKGHVADYPKDYIRFNNQEKLGYCDCPITAVYRLITGRSISLFKWDVAAQHMNLDHQLAKLIAKASDPPINYVYTQEELEIRQQLLQALQT